MQQADIEAVYEALAKGIDAAGEDGAGEDGAEEFLARACLLLAREMGDRDRALDLIRQALPRDQGTNDAV